MVDLVFSLILICLYIQIYELLVLETKPGNAVSIIECDMQVIKLSTIINLIILIYPFVIHGHTSCLFPTPVLCNMFHLSPGEISFTHLIYKSLMQGSVSKCTFY